MLGGGKPFTFQVAETESPRWHNPSHQYATGESLRGSRYYGVTTAESPIMRLNQNRFVGYGTGAAPTAHQESLLGSENKRSTYD